MTERELTDEEVISELQSASEWFTEHGRNTNTAIIGICDRAVDLINRQKAEIERLQNTLDDVLDREPVLVERSEKYAKSEAIKEFAERLRKYYDSYDDYEDIYAHNIRDDIDFLVKEMTEGQE